MACQSRQRTLKVSTRSTVIDLLKAEDAVKARMEVPLKAEGWCVADASSDPAPRVPTVNCFANSRRFIADSRRLSSGMNRGFASATERNPGSVATSRPPAAEGAASPLSGDKFFSFSPLRQRVMGDQEGSSPGAAALSANFIIRGFLFSTEAFSAQSLSTAFGKRRFRFASRSSSQ